MAENQPCANDCCKHAEGEARPPLLTPAARNLCEQLELTLDDCCYARAIAGSTHLDREAIICYALAKQRISWKRAIELRKAGKRPATQHDGVRRRAADCGIRTKFPGASSAKLEELMERAAAEPTKHLHFMTKERRNQTVHDTYTSMFDGVTITDLASLFPERKWERYLAKGWTSLKMHLSEDEKREIQTHVTPPCQACTHRPTPDALC